MEQASGQQGLLTGPLAAADPDEEPGQDQRSHHEQDGHQDQVLVGGQDPPNQDHQAYGGQHRPDGVERTGRVGGHRVNEAAAEQHDDHDDEGLEDEGGPPADGRGDQAADQRPGGGADAAHAADQPERPRTGFDVAEQYGGEDVDGRDQQGGADALEDGVAQDQHAEPGCGGAQDGANPVDEQPELEQPFAAIAVGQLAARDHQRGHHQQEQGDADLDALDVGVQVVADVVDHDVHVRARETTDELGQGQRHQHLPQRRSRDLSGGAAGHVHAFVSPLPRVRAHGQDHGTGTTNTVVRILTGRITRRE